MSDPLVRHETCTHCDGKGYIEWRGAQLRAKRLWRGLGLREVARRMKLTAAYLCDVELNRRRVTQRIQDFYDDL